jgi:hypothetical protein
MFDERVDALLVRCEQRRRLFLAIALQRGPALEAVLASERLLDDAQRYRPRMPDHRRQSVVRFAIARANGVQPALGAFPQRVEGCGGLERTRHAHRPSVVCLCPLAAGRKKVELLVLPMLGGSRLPCRGQVAPQRALLIPWHAGAGLSIAWPAHEVDACRSFGVRSVRQRRYFLQNRPDPGWSPARPSDAAEKGSAP